MRIAALMRHGEPQPAPPGRSMHDDRNRALNGCLNRMLLSHLLGLEITRALRIRQDWGAVNVLERRDGEWRPGTLNFNVSGMREFALTRRVAGVTPEVWQRLGR